MEKLNPGHCKFLFSVRLAQIIKLVQIADILFSNRCECRVQAQVASSRDDVPDSLAGVRLKSIQSIDRMIENDERKLFGRNPASYESNVDGSLHRLQNVLHDVRSRPVNREYYAH